MTSGTYPIFGTTIPVLLGRKREVSQVKLSWKNANISVVGPKYYGKTVLLNHLAEVARAEGYFAAVVTWKEEDLRCAPPRNDAEFWAALHRLLESQAEAARKYLPKRAEDANAESILDVFRFLDQDKKRLLLVWDGFDEPLLNGDLSPNLWNQLTKFADMKSVKLIVSSRKPLIELVPTQEAKMSDFWRRFTLVLRVGAFREEDWSDVVRPLAGSGITLEASGQKELQNWSGGIPILACELCGRIGEQHNGTVAIKAQDVNAVVGNSESMWAKQIWKDLPTDTQDELGEIAQRCSAQNPPTRSQVDAQQLEVLLERGLVVQSGNNVRPSSKIMAQHAVRFSSLVPNLRRVFGSKENVSSERSPSALTPFGSGRALGPKPQVSPEPGHTGPGATPNCNAADAWRF